MLLESLEADRARIELIVALRRKRDPVDGRRAATSRRASHSHGSTLSAQTDREDLAE